jgi:hypothetical protein
MNGIPDRDQLRDQITTAISTHLHTLILDGKPVTSGAYVDAVMRVVDKLHADLAAQATSADKLHQMLIERDRELETLRIDMRSVRRQRDKAERRLAATRKELTESRQFKSVPEGMVFNDYCSPKDVIKLMAERDAYIQRIEDLVATHRKVVVARGAVIDQLSRELREYRSAEIVAEEWDTAAMEKEMQANTAREQAILREGTLDV